MNSYVVDIQSMVRIMFRAHTLLVLSMLHLRADFHVDQCMRQGKKEETYVTFPDDSQYIGCSLSLSLSHTHTFFLVLFVVLFLFLFLSLSISLSFNLALFSRAVSPSLFPALTYTHDHHRCLVLGTSLPCLTIHLKNVSDTVIYPTLLRMNFLRICSSPPIHSPKKYAHAQR